jgi:hypothetical protein
VGHRTLVAVERRAGEFDCYRSRWGGVAPATDPAGDIAATVARVPPLARAASVSHVLCHIAPRTDETLLVRSLAGVESFLVRWLGVPTSDGDGTAPAILVPVDDQAAVERIDCALRTATGVLGDAVDAGLCPQWIAVGYLARFATRHPDIPDETVWLASTSDRA